MAPRSLQPGKRKLSSGGIDYQEPLELISEADGSAVVGWVGERVFYARFEGVLSMKLSAKHNARLEAALNAGATISYFSDASALTSYDLVARGTFARVVLAHRRQFAELVILTWASGETATSRSYAAVVGDPVDILTDEAAFERALLRSAPFAKRKLDPKTWKPSGVLPRFSR